MELADFAVKIEEVMIDACTSYECVFEDEDEIGRVWKFLIDDTLDGYLAVEDNDETLGFQTVTLGLYLRDITDYIREDLINLFYANSELINANLSVIKIPVPVSALQGEEETDEDFDELAAEPPPIEEREILTIGTRLPFDAFDTEDFRGYVENLLFQYQLLVDIDDDDEEAELEDDFEFINGDEIVDEEE
jgi:hypothetical protein